MGSSLDEVAVRHVAYLARLEVTDAEVARFDGVHYGYRTPHPKDIITKRTPGFYVPGDAS